MPRASLTLCTVAMVTALFSYSVCVAGMIRTVPRRQRHQTVWVAPSCMRRRRGRAPRTSTAGRYTGSLAPRQAPTPAGMRTSESATINITIKQRKSTLATVGNAAAALDPPQRTRKTSVAIVAKINNGSDSGEANTENAVELERCKRLAGKLGVELVLEGKESRVRRARGERDFRFTMIFDVKGRLGLGQPGSGFKPLVVDFSRGKNGHRAKQLPGTEQVVKAAALPKRRNGSSGPSLEDESTRELGGYEPEKPLLWDLTAGLGTDAFILALAGWRVEMFERSPIVGALLQDALERAKAGEDITASSAASRMGLTVADSIDIVTEVAAAASGGEEAAARYRLPAVVYLDPMFPKRKKTALVKKSMQMLQALEDEECKGREALKDEGGESVRKEEEERRLFDVAMRLATRKVVVKRPVHGPEIVNYVTPSHSVVSKNGRFDVYAVI